MHQSYSNAMTGYLEVIRHPKIGCEHTVSVHMSYQCLVHGGIKQSMPNDIYILPTTYTNSRTESRGSQ